MKNLTFLFISVLITSCSTLTSPYSTEHENAWFIESHGRFSYPVYCMANKKTNTAAPVCYRSIGKKSGDSTIESLLE